MAKFRKFMLPEHQECLAQTMHLVNSSVLYKKDCKMKSMRRMSVKNLNLKNQSKTMKMKKVVKRKEKLLLQPMKSRLKMKRKQMKNEKSFF